MLIFIPINLGEPVYNLKQWNSYTFVQVVLWWKTINILIRSTLDVSTRVLLCIFFLRRLLSGRHRYYEYELELEFEFGKGREEEQA